MNVTIFDIKNQPTTVSGEIAAQAIMAGTHGLDTSCHYIMLDTSGNQVYVSGGKVLYALQNSYTLTSHACMSVAEVQQDKDDKVSAAQAKETQGIVVGIFILILGIAATLFSLWWISKRISMLWRGMWRAYRAVVHEVRSPWLDKPTMLDVKVEVNQDKGSK